MSMLCSLDDARVRKGFQASSVNWLFYLLIMMSTSSSYFPVIVVPEVRIHPRLCIKVPTNSD